jgi:hypothetical protein
MTKHDDETAERRLLLAFHLQILGRIGQTGKYQCASMVAGHSVAHHYPACAFLASLGTYTPVAVSETPRMSAHHVVAFCLLPVFLLASALVLFCRRKAHKTFWQCGAIGKYKPVFSRDNRAAVPGDVGSAHPTAVGNARTTRNPGLRHRAVLADISLTREGQPPLSLLEDKRYR